MIEDRVISGCLSSDAKGSNWGHCLGLLGDTLCSSLLQTCRILAEAKRCQIPWDCSYRQLLANIWVLGIEPRFSGRATSALDCWAISLVLMSFSGVHTLSLSERQVSKGYLGLQSKFQDMQSYPKKKTHVLNNKNVFI